MKRQISLISIVITFSILLNYQSAYTYLAPEFSKTFYGDANGDMVLQLNDVTIHNTYILFGDANYDTPQPDTPTQKDDTCDLYPTGDSSLNDLTQIKKVILGIPVNILWDNWDITNIDLPANAGTGVATPFHLNVQATNLGLDVWGRPGINVKLTVAPDSDVSAASVFGRSCNPPAFQDGNCALSVSITNMSVDKQNSTTEVGANGFSFMADEAGTLTLLAEFSEQILLGIPATSVRFDVNIE